MKFRHKQTLEIAISKKGNVSRNSFYKACKAAGAKIEDIGGKIYLCFNERTLYLSAGEINLGEYKHATNEISDFAKQVLNASTTQP